MILQPSFRERISYFRQHTFVRNVATLQLGSFLGNFIQALIGVFLARLLQPERYGIYAIAFSLASLVFITTGVQEAVTVALAETYTKRDKEGTRNALAFFVKFTAIFAILTVIVALFLPTIGKIFYHNSSVGIYAAIVVIASVISSTLFMLVMIVLQAMGKIRVMNLLGITDQSIRYIFSLIMVIAGFGVLGAALGHFFGALIVFVISGFLWEKLRIGEKLFPSLRSLVKHIKTASLKKYLGFSLWITVDKNIASLYAILPVLLAGIFLSSSQVTFFKLAFGYVNLALSLLGPISTLLNFEFPKMKIEESGKLRSNFIRVSLYSMGLSVLLTLGAIVTAPFVFKIIYGKAFLSSVHYVTALLVYGCLFGIGVGLGPMWRAIDKVRVSIIINAVVMLTGIPLGLFLISSFGLVGAVAMVTVWFSVSHLISFFYLINHIDI